MMFLKQCTKSNKRGQRKYYFKKRYTYRQAQRNYMGLFAFSGIGPKIVMIDIFKEIDRKLQNLTRELK